MQALLELLLEEFKGILERSTNSTWRDYEFPEAKNMIKVAIGMRRSGKTFFLFQTIRKLLFAGVALNRILYLNFEDARLLPMDHKRMGQLVDAFYTLFPENHDHTCYLFLDEVQNVESWQLLLRRLHDTKNIQMYITGSSAKLLSKEIASSLRGRSLSIEILPYNYPEYLATHQLTLPEKPVGKRTLDLHHSYLQRYFQESGFPAVQQFSPDERRDALQSYVETVIFRDIVERHHITNISLLKYFVSCLLKNVATPFSINKFYNDCKSQAFQVGKDTLHAYLGHIEDAYLVFSVPFFSESLRRVQTTPKKIYAIDAGLVQANTFNLSTNVGKMFENQIYLDLRKQGYEIFYYCTSEGYEIDFVVRDKQGRFELLQVVWDMNDTETAAREQRALDKAQEELGISGRIIDWQSYIRSFTASR